MSPAASHPNLDVVNRVYEAMAAGDVQDDIGMVQVVQGLAVSGDGRHAGDYVGRDRVLGISGVTDGEPDTTNDTVKVHDILWTPEHVVVLVHATVERDGDTLAQNIVQVIHTDDTQVTEIWEYLWDQQADKVFWSRH